MGLSVLTGRRDNRETGARPVQSRCRKEQLFSMRNAATGKPGRRGNSAYSEPEYLPTFMFRVTLRATEVRKNRSGSDPAVFCVQIFRVLRHTFLFCGVWRLSGKMERVRITEFNKAAEAGAKLRWNSIAKPLGGLGVLEDMISRIAGMRGTPDVTLNHRTVVVMCADNGVVCEGVSQSDSSVTAAVARETARGRSSVNLLAGQFGAEVITVDIGMCTDVDDERILKRKAAYGTCNIAEKAAMSREQAESAVRAGIQLVRELAQNGTDIIITGEMGIGNTTTSAAIASVILGIPPEQAAGRGAGLDSAGLSRKMSAIKRAIAVNQPETDDPWDLLSKLGGLDIAGMTGLFLGGAGCGIPVVVDGVISAVSACLAELIAPGCRDFMLPSHVSSEPAGRLLLQKLELSAPIDAEFHLGEGTGGVMLLPLLDGALAVYNGAHRFDEMNMERYRELT